MNSEYVTVGGLYCCTTSFPPWVSAEPTESLLVDIIAPKTFFLILEVQREPEFGVRVLTAQGLTGWVFKLESDFRRANEF